MTVPVEYPPEITRKIKRAALWRVIVRSMLAIIAAAVLASSVAADYGVYLIRIGQVQGHQTLSTSGQTLRLLEDCLVVGHKCYAAEQARTTGIENDITSVQVVAAWCAVHYPQHTPVQDLACVRKELPILIASGR